MSKLAVLDDLLEHYYQLSYHTQPDILSRLQDVQAWQKVRMQRTHRAHFAEKPNQLMAEYFLNRLYGGAEFDALAAQIARLMKYAHKAEKVIPENAIKTGTLGVELAILAVQLDEQVAIQLLQDYHPHETLTDEMMRLTYLKLDQGQARLKQLALLDQLGMSLDKYMRSFVVYAAFKMCKGAANKYNFQVMYAFMQDGFLAMKPLKSAEKFVREFTATERQIIEKVHSGDALPFQ
ncbi:FFLEELY motif protein [Acinetobacter pseudolwoffii]|uniref:FFLEELY motif protein n=1 Tax=Acinetobacter pseudolwoffii TaxID=2053287 RepID=UPI003989B804